MNQTQALAKLRKLLGPKMGYRINDKALPADKRAGASLLLRETVARLKEVEGVMHARSDALLSQDAEYQTLRKRVNELTKERGALTSACMHQRITVVTTGAMFNSVQAEGDNWDDVVRQVTSK